MKFECKKEDLVNCLMVASKAVATKSTNMILECFLIEAAGNEVIFRSYDSSVSIQSKLSNATIMEEGKICVNAKLLEQIIVKLPDSNVLIQTDNDSMIEIKANKSSFKLVLQSVEAFPSIISLTEENKMNILASELKDLIRSTIFSIATDMSRPVLTGALLSMENGHLNMVTVDGYRVSKKSLYKEDFKDSSFKVIIPASTLNKLLKILHEDIEISIDISDKFIRFSTDDFCLISNLIEGTYIDYENILKTGGSFPDEMTINKELLLDAINRVSILCSDSKTPVIFDIENGSLKIGSKNQMACSEETVDVISVDSDIKIGFNVRFILDALKCVDSDTITIKYSNPSSGFLLNDESGLVTFFMLPIRLK